MPVALLRFTTGDTALAYAAPDGKVYLQLTGEAEALIASVCPGLAFQHKPSFLEGRGTVIGYSVLLQCLRFVALLDADADVDQADDAAVPLGMGVWQREERRDRLVRVSSTQDRDSCRDER